MSFQTYIRAVSLMLLFTTVALTACGSKVNCNDEGSKQTVLNLIERDLNGSPWYLDRAGALGSASLTNISIVAKNDDTGRASCAGKYVFTYNSKPYEVDVAYSVTYLQDSGKVTASVDPQPLHVPLMGIIQGQPPVRNGVQRVLDPATGNLRQKITWQNNKQNGEQEMYDPSTGKMVAQFNMVDGVKEGAEKGWSSDGSQLLTELTYVNGKATGRYRLQDPVTRELVTDMTFVDNKPNGFQTTTDSSGARNLFTYKDGVYDGIHKVFYDQAGAKIMVIENYKMGKLDGLSQFFRNDGKLTVETVYKEGVEVSKTEH